MSRSRVEVVVLVGLLILVLGWILHTVGTATNEWVVADSNAAIPTGVVLSDSLGLFEICPVQGGCVTIEDEPAQLKAAQALCIIAILLAGIAALLTVLFLLLACMRKARSNTLPSISFFLCILSALCILIGIVVWDVDYFTWGTFGASYDYYDLGYSFALCVAGGALIFIGGGIIMIGAYRSSSYHQRMEAHAPPPSQVAYHTGSPGSVMYVQQPGTPNYAHQSGTLVHGQQPGVVAGYSQNSGGHNYGHHNGGYHYSQQTVGINHVHASSMS